MESPSKSPFADFDATAAPQSVEKKPLASKSPSLLPARRRTGKIARLPEKLRDHVNRMLLDGKPYSAIAKKLAERGHDLNADNLSRWHAGGYQDWLQDRTRLEQMRLRLDFASHIVQQKNGAGLDAAGLRIAVSQMYTLLSDFDPVVLKDQIATQPGAYSRILNALCNLIQSRIKCQRH